MRLAKCLFSKNAVIAWASLLSSCDIANNCCSFLQMVAQFSDDCVGCSQTSLKQRELERFVTRFRSLNSDEVAVALMVTSKEVLDLLSQLVPCVGCRKR